MASKWEFFDISFFTVPIVKTLLGQGVNYRKLCETPPKNWFCMESEKYELPKVYNAWKSVRNTTQRYVNNRLGWYRNGPLISNHVLQSWRK